MHIMMDLETLGKKPGCVVLSIGARVFEPIPGAVAPLALTSVPAQPYDPTFYRNLSIFPQLMAGLHIDPSTVDWWTSKSKEAKAAIADFIVTPEKAIYDFSRWIETCGRSISPKEKSINIWAKSPDFDCAIWEHLAYVFPPSSVEIPWEFRDKRDVRTIIEAARLIPQAPGTVIPGVTSQDAIAAIAPVNTKHNALDDCEYQIRQVQAAFAMMKGSPNGTA